MYRYLGIELTEIFQILAHKQNPTSMRKKIYRVGASLCAGIVISLAVASCGEEIVLIEQEDTSKLDSLETVIRTVEEDLKVAIQVEADLKRKVDSLNARINAGASGPSLADIVYSIQVVDGSSAFFNTTPDGRVASLPDATVTVRQHGEVFQMTTDGTGMVSFPNMKSGLVSVTVEIDGFSDVYMIADLRDGGDDENETSSDNRYASSQVVVFPTEGNSMFTISGKVYYNQNELNDNRDGSQNNPLHPVTGTAVYETAADVYLVLDCLPGSILNNTDRPGRIVEAVYAGLKRTTVSEADGSYTLTLPVILTADGQNFFDYSSIGGSSISGSQITVANGTINQTWFISFLYPGFSVERILPGANTIQDIYYEP